MKRILPSSPASGAESTLVKSLPACCFGETDSPCLTWYELAFHRKGTLFPPGWAWYRGSFPELHRADRIHTGQVPAERSSDGVLGLITYDVKISWSLSFHPLFDYTEGFLGWTKSKIFRHPFYSLKEQTPLQVMRKVFQILHVCIHACVCVCTHIPNH